MHVITFDGEERHVHHSDRECAWCGEPSPFADYCSAECHGKGEHKSECDTCHEIIDCAHDCAHECPSSVPGDHQRTMYSLECPGCERHPIAYRDKSALQLGRMVACRWIVSCEDCGFEARKPTLAAAIELWKNPVDPEEEARCAGDWARDEAIDRELEGV